MTVQSQDQKGPSIFTYAKISEKLKFLPNTKTFVQSHQKVIRTKYMLPVPVGPILVDPYLENLSVIKM